MTINFLPNDPLAKNAPAVHTKAPRPDPRKTQAGFSHAAAFPEGLYSLGTPAFLFWQCREAALAALETWAMLEGPLTQWQNGGKLLPLSPNSGSALNAYYDRQGLSFFEWKTGAKKTFSGASADAVAHEAGHAFLDAIRPELWDSVYAEVAAFHEAFADCIALLVGFLDSHSRQALLQGAAGTSALRAQNFLEALAEDVADGVRRTDGPGHPHASPRHALNNFRWEFPVNLPPVAVAASLSAEAHSFSRVFSGCFYDALCNIFAAGPSQDDAALLSAARIAGKLLIAGTKKAPEVTRFFQAVGRSMILADQELHGGRHHRAIRDAFSNHNVALGSSAMLAPTSALSGSAPRLTPGTPPLDTPVRRELLARMGAAPHAKMSVNLVRIAGQTIVKAVHQRAIGLGTLDRRLKEIVAMAAESVLIGARAKRAAVLGHLPDVGATKDEAMCFVGTLLRQGAIAFQTIKQDRAAPENNTSLARLPTHAIRDCHGKKILARLRFACCPGAEGSGR
ncbi:MAG: hypothetical protein ACREXS_01585 [Gammaproteobacteria bacterium]